MIGEMKILESNWTWTLVPPYMEKYIFGCHWVYTVKVGPYERIDHLKSL